MDLAALVAAVAAIVAALTARHHAKRAATFHRAALSSAGRPAASALRVDGQRGDERDDAVRCRIAAAARTDGRVAVVKPCLDRTPHAPHDTGDGEPLVACPGVPEPRPGAGGLAVPQMMLDMAAEAHEERDRVLNGAHHILAEHAPWSVWKWCLKTEHHGQHPTPGGKMCPGVLGPDISSTLPGRPV